MFWFPIPSWHPASTISTAPTILSRPLTNIARHRHWQQHPSTIRSNNYNPNRVPMRLQPYHHIFPPRRIIPRIRLIHLPSIAIQFKLSLLSNHHPWALPPPAHDLLRYSTSIDLNRFLKVRQQVWPPTSTAPLFPTLAKFTVFINSTGLPAMMLTMLPVMAVVTVFPLLNPKATHPFPLLKWTTRVVSNSFPTSLTRLLLIAHKLLHQPSPLPTLIDNQMIPFECLSMKHMPPLK